MVRHGATIARCLAAGSTCLLLASALVLGGPAATAASLRDDVEGTPYDDVLRGTHRADRLWAGDGYNVLFGLSGADRLHAGRSRDDVFAGRGADLLRGRAGRDLLAPGRGADSVVAGPSRDVVTLAADGRRDRVDCGGGRDVVRYRHRRDREDRIADCERVVRTH